jgi:hypothetical protein
MSRRSTPFAANGSDGLSAKDRRGGYHYDFSILQAEFFAHSDLRSGAASSNLAEILKLGDSNPFVTG